MIAFEVRQRALADIDAAVGVHSIAVTSDQWGQKMSHDWKLFIAAGAMAALISTNSQAGNVRFCPAESEIEIRQVLGIGQKSSLSIAELERAMTTSGIRFEESGDNSRSRCDHPPLPDNTKTVFAYAGFDKTRSHVRTYKIFVQKDGAILSIDEFHQFPAPKL